MNKKSLLGKIENYGLIIISTGVALIYLSINSLQLGATPIQWITFFLSVTASSPSTLLIPTIGWRRRSSPYQTPINSLVYTTEEVSWLLQNNR